MKRTLLVILSLFVLAACGTNDNDKVDDEALQNISRALEKRWEYTETLPDELTMEDLEKAVQIELDELDKYSADDFKDTSLYVLYDRYWRDLELIQTFMIGESIDSPRLQENWKEHMEKRAKTLYDLNANYELDISDENKDVFEEVLAGSENLVAAEKVEESLSDIEALSDIEVVVEEYSISITYPTESALSEKSFVASKTGFPDMAIDILRELIKFDYEDVVISTTNQDSIAISSYFTKSSLDRINFERWDDLDSSDAYEFYNMTDAYHIRVGIWESLDEDIKQLIGDMNKENSNEFWKEHGFTH